MNQDQFSQWAVRKGLSLAKARAVFATAETAASTHSRTEPAYWTTLRKQIKAAVGSAPAIEAEASVKALHGLALHLRRSPGVTVFAEEGSTLVLTYQRDSSTGIQYPFSDHCDFQMRYDTVKNLWSSKGVVFGAAVQVPETNEPGVFFMMSLDQHQSYNAVVRDFFNRGQKIIERYGAQNLDLFAFKLQQQTRSLGIMEHVDASKNPLIAEFKAAEVPFSAWFALSNLGLPVIKFNPALSVPGYQLSLRTFNALLEALDKHIVDHTRFTEQCIAATNQFQG